MVVQQWLFGHQRYKKLQISQADLDGIYFNCFLTNPSVITNANLIYGFTCRVVCDSPFAWSYKKTDSFTFGGIVTNTTVEVFNHSENNAYTYPYLRIITPNVSNGFVKITNTSDTSNSIPFEITGGISPSDTILVDNDLGIFTSNTQNLFENFNKRWLRLVPGRNVLSVFGNVLGLSLEYIPAKKIGG
jgi:hypothetical protein